MDRRLRCRGLSAVRFAVGDTVRDALPRQRLTADFRQLQLSALRDSAIDCQKAEMRYRYQVELRT